MSNKIIFVACDTSSLINAERIIKQTQTKITGMTL